MRHALIRTMEQNPVVPALKDLSHLEECLRCPSGVVFVLCGDILNVDDIIRRLHDGGKKAVIHDISFSLQAGTLTALIGANGSGKTTLMKCIANQLSHGGKSILLKILWKKWKRLCRKFTEIFL